MHGVYTARFFKRQPYPFFVLETWNLKDWNIVDRGEIFERFVNGMIPLRKYNVTSREKRGK